MISPEVFFQLLSDETRLRCLLLLQRRGKLCVCELAKILEVPQPKLSRHLSLLRQSKVICDERRGQWIFYSLSDDLPEWMKRVMESLKEFYVADCREIEVEC
jgi:ArsR family transcriptional regulator, arsenate/arsenite/antimonite-responsive transcriptional repressor